MTGILLLDKPAGMTSHDVVAKVRKVLATREVGHAGTLDPQATGLLVLAVGGATRWLPWLLASKTYRTSLRLGLATDTEDVWGVPIAQDEAPAPGEAAWRGALEGLTRLTEQVPPMVSALKVGGRRLYELAREGRSVERAPRPVSITAVRVLAVRGQEADLDVDCGPGTYVRSLCVEAGRRLGRPACMTSLRRLRSGAFDVEQALPPERWAADGFGAALLGADAALAHLPCKGLLPSEAVDVSFGRSVAGPAEAQGTWRLNSGGRLLALAQAGPGGRLQPKKVFAA
jgi:tRNA pseudouridine55 synthase